ncbi:MAG: C10 family peptidase [Bacteroidales bacterium]
MKTIKSAFFVLFAAMTVTSGYCQMVSKQEATVIAENWIRMIIDQKGHWGGQEKAHLESGQNFQSGSRLIGYYFGVKPSGYIVVSLRKELAPVKAYDDRFTLDPEAEGGMTDLIKTAMMGIIETIESKLGPVESINPATLSGITEIDYVPSWNYITGYVQGMIQKDTVVTDNYLQGAVLLTSQWHQFPPYNNECPNSNPPCTTTSNGRTLVGCVATAGAQIMKYWSWPPYRAGAPFNDPYDWANMVDDATTSSPAAVQAAVAELSAEVGVAVGMSYGCNGSSAVTADMVNVYKVTFAYHTSCTYTFRSDHSAIGWFDLIKWNINANRPIQYRVIGHSIVCDGWDEIGSPVTRMYHMNYGWIDQSATTWYTLDALPLGGYNEEYMVIYIVPMTAMGAGLSGTYTTPAFPYRYFDLDASGSSATFNSGHMLQILPNLTIKGTGPTSYVRFYGATGANTKIFTNGDPTEGIAIKNGGVRLRNNGTIKLQ